MRDKGISRMAYMMLGLVIAAVILGLIERGRLSSIYDESIKEFNNGNYQQALELMESISPAGNYRDLAERIPEVKKYVAYEDANTQYSKGNKLEALKLFINLGDFKDSEYKVKVIICDYARDLEVAGVQP